MFKRKIDTIYEQLLDKYDKKIDQLGTSNNRKCVCCKGCSHCCHQLIIITDFEKEMLKYTISTLFRKDRDRLYKKVKEQCSVMELNNLNKTTINPFLNEQEQLFIQNKFFSLNMECPFLKDNMCSIHHRRQISCMTYRNYGNPNECKDSATVSNTYTFNNIEIELRQIIQQMTGVFPDGFNILQFAILEILEKGDY